MGDRVQQVRLAEPDEQGPSSKLAIKTPHLFLVQDDIAIAVKLIDAQFPPTSE